MAHFKITMKDLTNGSIVNHILLMAAPVVLSMFTQIAYQLVNLYFVAKIGIAATAGVNVAGNIVFIVTALTQVLGVGTTALVARSAGRQDQADANQAFNQALALSLVCGAVTMAILYVLIWPYLRSISADVATVNAGVTFINWALPGYALMFPLTVIGSALRGIGIVHPTIAINILTVIINAILAPILIAGWVTGVPMGVKGAGLATTVSIVAGIIFLGVYFQRAERYLAIRLCLMRPQLRQWRRMLDIGLPVGVETALIFISSAVVYYAIRDLGASAQAGFGIGWRVLQTILLPGAAIAFAAGPIVGQNFGAKNSERVRETFRKAALIGAAVMIATTIVLQRWTTSLVSIFDADASAITVAAVFLQLRSWGLVAHGFVYTCSHVFQGLGNTVPSLISSVVRFLAFSIPAVWLSMQPRFRIEQLWYLWIASVVLQATLSLWLLSLELTRRLPPTKR